MDYVNILAGDSLIQLAFSVYENKGVYALLLGSGLSRAAEIPTGWEVTVDLIRRVALARGVGEQLDWAAWYRQETGNEPDYSVLLAELGASPEERRSILHSYIEPAAADREAGRKVPTVAHYAIADLVRAGYIRVIITTNFDRLMENALRERGVEPTIIASVDSLAGAEPITHSRCYLLKLHGDYKDARILNTEAELSGYPAAYDALLDRIIDEHGMLICGWSGEWDNALRSALLRAPNRRYSVFWALRGEPKSGAAELINQRGARVVQISDADSFFSGLQRRIETLAATHRQNPLSVDILVGSAKRFLSKAEYRIELDQLFSEEVGRVLEKLNSSEFDVPNTWSQAEFRVRVKRYEAAIEPLACMMGALGRWGDGRDTLLALDVIRSLYAQAELVCNGLTVYLNLRSYPAVLTFCAYGLGLVRANRWTDLHSLFKGEVSSANRDPSNVVESLFLWAWKGTEQDAWKQIEGMENKKTPLSEHLVELFGGWSGRFLGLVPDFELLFERFEFLGSLAHLERNDKSSIARGLQENPQQGWTWMPLGRVSWHGRNADRLIGELQSEPAKSAILAAGFAKGDAEYLELFISNFRLMAGRMRW